MNTASPPTEARISDERLQQFIKDMSFGTEAALPYFQDVRALLCELARLRRAPEPREQPLDRLSFGGHDYLPERKVIEQVMGLQAEIQRLRSSEPRALRAALEDLTAQVKRHCVLDGEAGFYTGSALAALGHSANPVHLQTLAALQCPALTKYDGGTSG